MGGHRQRKIQTVPYFQDGQDPHEIYQAAIRELAAAINWDYESVCYHWSQIALARMSCGESQDFAEYMALANVRYALDCRGRDAN